MSVGGARLLRTGRARAVHGAAALLLASTVVSTGFVALALPAHAGPVAPDISSPPPVVTSNDPSPAVVFSGPGAQYECAAAPSTDPSPAYVDCGSPWPVPTLPADGTYTLSVREKSLANDGTPDTVSYTLDTVAALTVTPPTSPGNVVRPSWDISSEPSAVVTCALDGGAEVACDGGFTPGVDLGEGPHSLTVSVTDPSGNTATDTSTYLLDTTAPAPPAEVTGSTGTANDTTPSWTWANPEGAAALCTLTGPGLPAGEVACTTSTTDTRTISTEGDYQLSVVLRDAAGNRSTATAGPTYTLDTTAPAPAVFSSGPTGTGTTSSVSWSFSTPGASAQCDLVGALAGTVSSTSCTSPAAYTLPSDDSWKLVVTVDDGLGNTVATDSAAYVLDTTGPSAVTVSAPSGISNDATPHITWSGGELPSTAECRWQRTVGSTTTDGPWTGCDARFFDPTLPGDGSYLFQVQLTDPLGNVGDIASSASPYLYDGTPPDPPALTTPSTPGNDPTPTVTFTPESPGGQAACTSYAGTTAPPAPTWTDCTSGSFSPTLDTDGTWTLAVTLTDEAGNTSAPATFAYDLDTAAPTAVTIAGPTGPSNVRSPSWTLTADPADALACRVLLGSPPSGGQVGATTACTTAFVGDLSAAADGDYTVEVTATDAVGNATVSTWPYTLDTSAPTSPQVTGPGGSGNDPAPTWTFPVQPDTTAQCRLVQGLSMSDWDDCSDGSYTVTDPADGSYTVDVLVTDLAGNDAPLASSPTYTSDRTAPAAPVVLGPTGPNNDPAPTWTWTGEAGATATCRLDRDGVVGSPVPCDDGTFSPALSGDAGYVVAVQLSDAAGNLSPETALDPYLLDTDPPAPLTVTGPTGTSNDDTVSWSWPSEAGSTSTCTLVRDGTTGAPGTCLSGATVTLPGDGSYVLQVVVTDAAGNSSPAGVSEPYVLDTSAPAAPQVSTPVSPAADRAPSFDFVAEAAADAQCRWWQGTTLVDDWSPCSTPYVADLSASPDGDYSLDVRVTDAAGNTSDVGSSLAYRLDTTAPLAPIVTMPSGPSTTVDPVITWTGEAGAVASCVLTHDGATGSPVSCATPWQPALSGDGAWTVDVTLTDAAGNTGPAGSGGPYALDTTAPDAPVLTAPASPSSVLAPVWTATLGAGDTAECTTTAPGRTVADWAPCAFPLTTDLSAEPDDTYTLSVRAVDEVGLTSPTVSADYVLDTTGPVPPTISGTSSPGSSTAPVFSFQAEPGSTTSCAVTSGSTVVSADAPCSSPVTLDLSAQPDAVYTLTVTTTDAAGNPGAAGSISYTLDRVAPDAPVATSSPASPAPDTAPSWSFSAEAGAVFTCTVTGAQAGPVSAGSCDSPFTANLPTDDTYTLSVTATDAAGNTSAPLVLTYELDTTAPAAPVLTAPASPGQSTTPHWDVTATEGTPQCQLSFGGSVVVDWTDCTGGFTASLGGADGSYTLAARAVDSAGNTSAVATSDYLLDRTAPGAPQVETPLSPSTSLQPTWVVTAAEDGLTASCQVTGPAGPLASATCSAPPGGAPFTADLTGLADGSYTLTVTVTDAAGNATSATSAAYVLDTTAPNQVLVTAPRSPSMERVVTWGLVGDVDAELECMLSGPGLPDAAMASCPGSAGGQGSFTAALTTSPDGSYVLTVRSRDAAGNLSPAVSSAYVLDTQAPGVPTGVRATVASPSNTTGVSWVFTTEPGSTGLCQLLSATAVVTGEQLCSAPYLTDLSSRPDGLYTLSVRAQDPAGNISPGASADYALDRTAPGAPVITKTPGSPSPVQTPAWTVQPADATDRLECQLIGLAGSSWAPCSSSVTYDLAPATAGRFTLQVRETDAAGNVSPIASAATYVLDGTVPFPPEVSPPAASPDNSTSPVFTISRAAGDPGEQVTLACSVTRFDGKPATATPCAFGPVTVALSGIAPRVEGPVTLSVKSTDAAGNASGAATASYLYDGIPPGPAQIRPLASDVGTSPRVTWSFGEPSGLFAAERGRSESLTESTAGTDVTTFRCQLAKAGLSPSLGRSTACTSPHTELLTQVGTWAFWVWAVDQAGNAALPVSSRYTFVSKVPAVTDLRTPAPGPDAHPVWTFTVPGGYSAHCLLSNASAVLLAESSCNAGRYTADLSRQPFGAYTVTVQLVDSQGLGGPFTKSSPYGYRVSSPHTTPVVQQGPGAGATGRPPTGPVAPPTAVTPARGTPVDRGLPVKGSGKSGPRTTTTAIAPAAPGAFITKEATKAIGKTLAQVAQKPTIPLVLLGVVVGFLLLQNRIDRRDPKLATAPVGAEPELDFGPVQGFQVSPAPSGGAPA